MPGRVIAVLAGCAAIGCALPSAAAAQNGFPDYRQAAADQYPTQPPPGNSGSSENHSAGGAGASNSGSSGNARPVGTPHRSTPARANRTKNAAARRGAAPIAVPSTPVPTAKGSLPFTGSDLSGLVVLALILLAAGFLTAAAARAMRRRRRRAPA